MSVSHISIPSDSIPTNIQKLVRTAVKETAGFPKASTTVLEAFCIDVSLVCIGFRTAYLVDHFSISETTANVLITNLQKNEILRGTIALYHRELCQLFFCNATQLQARILESIGDSPWTVFIREVAVAAQPTFVRALCQDILEENVAFNLSISRLSAYNMIALAGFLLEYPISYYLEEEQLAFLANVPLDVFECRLFPKYPNSGSHSFMNFSRPSTLTPPTHVLIDKLKKRFHSRICLAIYAEDIVVHCKSITMDRAAL